MSSSQKRAPHTTIKLPKAVVKTPSNQDRGISLPHFDNVENPNNTENFAFLLFPIAIRIPPLTLARFSHHGNHGWRLYYSFTQNHVPPQRRTLNPNTDHEPYDFPRNKKGTQRVPPSTESVSPINHAHGDSCWFYTNSPILVLPEFLPPVDSLRRYAVFRLVLFFPPGSLLPG